MKVINMSKNAILAEDITLARGVLEKAEGLSGTAVPHAIFFRAEWGTCPIPKSEHTTIYGKLFHIFRNCIRCFINFPLFWCGVHTFGMRFPIDVIVMDDAYIVQTVRRNLKPNRFFFWNPKYRNVIEFPAGTADGSNTATGDALAFSPEEMI